MSLFVASNRGPLSFRFQGDTLESVRGGGGLASGILGALRGREACWVSSATSDADRVAVGKGLWTLPGIDLHPVAISSEVYDSAYNRISNETLWFLFHGIFDAAYLPVFDSNFSRHLEAYYRYNDAFAREIADKASSGDTVMVNDYHLLLVPKMLKELRADLQVTFFLHTPFPYPNEFLTLPGAFARAILESLHLADLVGFHAEKWLANFQSCLKHSGIKQHPNCVVAPLPTDADALRVNSRTVTVANEQQEIVGQFGTRQLIVRVDRMELSKNIVRGFLAVDELITQHPDLKEQFIHLALCYPSRESLASYRRYAKEVVELAARINTAHGTSRWNPIELQSKDNYSRSLAALRLADTILINPVRDGLNLVAQEGVLLNERSANIVLSSEAGIAEHIGDLVDVVNPFDVSQTASTLYSSLTKGDKNALSHKRLLSAITQTTPSQWLDTVTGNGN
jgi:trehalose 6-phosphate synthase